MIKMFSASTVEIDNPEVAISEILSGLDLGELSEKSFGIINCHAEFIDNGTVSALCGALPFDTLGCTTVSSSDSKNGGAYSLTLSVITGDNISLSGVMSDSLSEDYETALRDACGRALWELRDKPAMAFVFAPLIYNVGGDKIVSAIDKYADGTPLFGTLAIDHTADYSEARTIFNGAASREGCAIMFIAGDISPKFLLASISESKTHKQKAIITKSEGNILMEVNNTHINKYLEGFGIMSDNKILGANIIPFIVDYNDGTKPVARAIFATTPDGHIVCGGDMPVNATLGISSLDYDDILLGTKEKMREVKGILGVSGAVAFSCIGRFLALGVDVEAESDILKAEIGAKHPYRFAYSGGEICPVYDATGKVYNRYHNYTFIICVF